MKKILLFLLFASSSNILLSQAFEDNNAVALPSVNNNFLGIRNYGVSLYSGTAQISVPIYKLESKEVPVPIELVYRGSNGIKLQDVASQVGLGWQLQAGGSISRMIRGLPDEEADGYTGVNHRG